MALAIKTLFYLTFVYMGMILRISIIEATIVYHNSFSLPFKHKHITSTQVCHFVMD